jgi:hypothetical protein
MGSMYYNGTYMGSETYGVIVASSNFVVSSQPRTRRAEFGQKAGGARHGGYRAMLDLRINCRVIGTDWKDLKTKADAIVKLLDPTDGDKTIVLDERNDRQWTGRLVSPILPPVLGCAAFDMPLTFAVDPIAESTTLTTQTFTITTDPDTITVPASGVVAGNMRAVPVWKIENTNASNVTDHTVNNTTTTQSVQNTKTIQQNEFIRHDTERQITEFSADDSTYSSAMNLMDATDKTFPELQDGVSNSITVTGFTDATVTITYRARY